MKYLAILGRQPEISLAELKAQFKNVRRVSDVVATFESERIPDLNRFGGSLKFAEKLDDSFKSLNDFNFSASEDEVLRTIAKFLVSKQKVYNLKSLNTMQLYELRNECLFLGTKSYMDKKENKINGTVNIGINGYLELFGVHYEDVGPETKIISDIEKSNYSTETLKCENGEYDKDSITETYEKDEEKYKNFLSEYIKLKYHTPGSEVKSCSNNKIFNDI